MKANYHTHTRRCYHAIGSDEEYVVSAIKAGYDVLGFSDHTPWDYKSKFQANMRMPLNQFDDYYNSIYKLKIKYQDQIKILIGLECEYFEEYMPWLKAFIIEKNIDYILLGNHYYQSDEKQIYFGRACATVEMLNVYVDECIKGMKTNLYSYLAHPDLFMRAYPSFDEACIEASYRLCEAAKQYDIPLEYNLSGVAYNEMLKVEEYPHPKFWEIASKVGNRVMIGVDAHDNKDLENSKRRKQAEDFLNRLGCNLVEEIDLKDFNLSNLA
ncbi:MAG: histidinol-phosphatase [Erysipelotrichaceae bacterium]